jgi:hypothetical protein
VATFRRISRAGRFPGIGGRAVLEAPSQHFAHSTCTSFAGIEGDLQPVIDSRCLEAAPTDTPTPSVIIALAGAAGQLQGDHAALIDKLAARKIRTLPEAGAVSRLALSLPPYQGYDLLIRVARYVRRLEGETTR